MGQTHVEQTVPSDVTVGHGDFVTYDVVAQPVGQPPPEQGYDVTDVGTGHEHPGRDEMVEMARHSFSGHVGQSSAVEVTVWQRKGTLASSGSGCGAASEVAQKSADTTVVTRKRILKGSCAISMSPVTSQITLERPKGCSAGRPEGQTDPFNSVEAIAVALKVRRLFAVVRDTLGNTAHPQCNEVASQPELPIDWPRPDSRFGAVSCRRRAASRSVGSCPQVAPWFVSSRRMPAPDGPSDPGRYGRTIGCPARAVGRRGPWGHIEFERRRGTECRCQIIYIMAPLLPGTCQRAVVAATRPGGPAGSEAEERWRE